MKQGCNFQEVCMLTASHCDSRLVRSVSSPWSTNHHRIRLESGESLLVLRLTLRLDSSVQNLWITFLTVPTVQLLTVPQILCAPSTLALLLWAVLLLAALLLEGTVPGALGVELGGLFELWCVRLDFFRTSVICYLNCADVHCKIGTVQSKHCE